MQILQWIFTFKSWHSSYYCTSYHCSKCILTNISIVDSRSQDFENVIWCEWSLVIGWLFSVLLVSVAQLVKSRDNKTRLMIAFNNGKKKEYSFEHAKVSHVNEWVDHWIWLHSMHDSRCCQYSKHMLWYVWPNIVRSLYKLDIKICTIIYYGLSFACSVGHT